MTHEAYRPTDLARPWPVLLGTERREAGGNRSILALVVKGRGGGGGKQEEEEATLLPCGDGAPTKRAGSMHVEV